MPRAQLHAYVSPSSPAQENAFNKWFDEIHIPQVVERIPGIIGGRRYRLSETQLVPAEDLPTRRYLSIYEIDTHDLPAVADQLVQALGDGTLDITDAIDMHVLGPVLHFYESV
ncbi:hypothetical protein [Streptomyces purpurogeneiscleroticus]|uniref:hypothetical protein n=1 Tax=Streptomyces purpurogeneiscleroticus TaxID=68259 RepID=UPI001CBFD63A|nr:hypothetical protein [Streptomyces purpurogeneiscleroticus]MBZ4016253.1 hypothetical protein [Streptomyces purpurogeneiscleroticus]